MSWVLKYHNHNTNKLLHSWKNHPLNLSSIQTYVWTNIGHLSTISDTFGLIKKDENWRQHKGSSDIEPSWHIKKRLGII